MCTLLVTEAENIQLLSKIIFHKDVFIPGHFSSQQSSMLTPLA